MAVTVWKGLGWSFTCGLQSIPPDCMKQQQLTARTASANTGILRYTADEAVCGVVAVISAISATKVFEVYIMTQGGPRNSSKQLFTTSMSKPSEFGDELYACDWAVLFLEFWACQF